MSVTSGQVTVGTTAVALNSTGGKVSMALVNRGSITCYLGASAVSSTSGFALEGDEAVSPDVSAADLLYARTSTGTTTVHVLRITGV